MTTELDNRHATEHITSQLPLEALPEWKSWDAGPQLDMTLRLMNFSPELENSVCHTQSSLP